MQTLLVAFEFSLGVTGPIFVVLALGIILRRAGFIDEAFIDTGTKLVFNVALPALLFVSIAKSHFSEAANLPLMAHGLFFTTLAYFAFELVAARWVHDPRDRGIVVQGAFRSNMGIIGLAYCVNAYGEAGLIAASVYLGVVTILFNVLSVITLNRTLGNQRGLGPVLLGIARNPLIIGIALALPVSWFNLPLPGIVIKSGEYFAQLTLPLALLCTGASLSLDHLRSTALETWLATAGKLLVVPLLFVISGILAGFRGLDLGILLLMQGNRMKVMPVRAVVRGRDRKLQR